ncbi:alpha/beta hydrolase [Sessilibacter corallicola]
MPKSRFVVPLVLLIGMAFISVVAIDWSPEKGTSDQTQASQNLTLTECQYEFTNNAYLLCGYYTTPGNSAVQYELPFVVINGEEMQNPKTDSTNSTNSTNALRESINEALMVLHGGPGAGVGLGRTEIHSWIGWYQQQRISGPLIVFDYRSTGLSTPYYDCEPRSFAPDRSGSSPVEQQENLFAEFKLCLEQIKHQGAHELDFSSKTTAWDAIALAKALGVESLNVYANSFGTRVALWLDRLEPNLINRMILDALHTPTNGDMNRWPQRYVGAFKQWFAFCASDRSCDASEQKLFQALKVNNDLSVYPTADTFIETLYSNLYFAGGYVINNQLIDEVIHNQQVSSDNNRQEDAQTRPLSSNLKRTQFNKFVHYLTNCVDNPPVSLTQFDRNKSEFPRWQSLIHYDPSTDVCHHVKTNNQIASVSWDSIQAKSLILSGGLDPVTSYRSAAEFFPNFNDAIHVSVHDGGHGLVESQACFTGLISYYLSGYNINQFLDANCSHRSFNITQ